MAIVIFEHSALSGSGRLGEVLKTFGHQLRVVRLHEDEPMPVDLDDVDGVISCGGGGSANDDSIPWLAAEMDYLERAVAAELPVVGLCFGHQLLVRTLGGSVRTMPDGIELGWHRVDLTPAGREDPLHAGIAWSSMQPHWHRDEVHELPPGARLLAGSDRCPHQTWALGLRTYGFQYHPEIDRDAFARWVDDDPKALEEAGVTREQLEEATARHYDTAARLARRLFESMALLLMPLDRRYGVAKDLHH